MQLLGNLLPSAKRLFRSDSLLLASAFPCKSLPLSAGAVEFVVLSGRAVEAVGTLAQRVPLRAWLSPVLNYHRLVWVRDPGNWRDLHFGNLAHGAAGRFSDLAEGVQVLEFYRYLLHLSRSAHCVWGGTGEQLAQRLPLFRARARIYIVSSEGELGLPAHHLLNEFTSLPNLHTVQLHPSVLAIVDLANLKELA